MRKLGERIKELREEQNLSVQALSRATGIQASSISRWENGRQDITGDNLIVLADFFKVSADFLLGRED